MLSRYWILLGLGALLFAASPRLSFAQSGSPSDVQKAEAAFNKAEQFYNLGDWKSALDNYKEAYLLSNEPLILFNIAQCQRQMGTLEEALRTYKTFLRVSGLSPGDQQYTLAENLIKEVEAQIEKQKTTTPTTTPIVENPPIGTPNPPQTKPTDEPTPAAKTPLKKALPLFLGAGGAFVVMAASGLAAIDESKKLEELHENPNADQREIDQRTQATKVKAAVSDIALLASLGCAAGGVVLYMGAKKAEASLQVTPQSVAVSVHF